MPEKRIDLFNQSMQLKAQQTEDVICNIVDILKNEELTIQEAITLLDKTKSVILQSMLK